MSRRKLRSGLDFIEFPDGSRSTDTCTIGARHPAKPIIEAALLRRGDHPAAAQGRAIAIAELLIRADLLKAP